MAWERVVIQDGVEVVAEGQSVTEQEARDWLEFKRAAHSALGWTATPIALDSFDAARTEKEGLSAPKTRTILIRQVP